MSASETIEVLRRARGYVERGWTQGAYARDASGERTVDRGSFATCWCASGAIWKAFGWGSGNAVTFAHAALRKAVREPISDWNDAPGRTQAEVLAAFDRAIALIEAEGGS